MALDLKMISLQKTIGSGYHIELALGMAILAVASWSVACIQQPKDPLSHKHSNSQKISVQSHCPGPKVLDHHHALAPVENTVA